jgi:hypothetical protein
MAEESSKKRAAEAERWADLSRSTDFPSSDVTAPSPSLKGPSDDRR